MRSIDNYNVYELLLSRISIQPNGCWLYTGTIRPDGYGYIGFKNIGYIAHRVSYFWYYGHQR